MLVLLQQYSSVSVPPQLSSLVVKLSKHNVLLFIFSPDKGFWYVPGEFAILQYGMWECSKVGNNAYFRLFKLAAGKLFHVPSCAFDTNDVFVFV